MAWYDITYSCGHEGREQIYGSGDRMKRARWIGEHKVCPECYEKQREEQRRREREYGEHAAKELGLPELEGSRRQIAWAVAIRGAVVKRLRERVAEWVGPSYLPDHDRRRNAAEDSEAWIAESVSLCKDASRWINGRCAGADTIWRDHLRVTLDAAFRSAGADASDATRTEGKTHLHEVGDQG